MTSPDSLFQLNIRFRMQNRAEFVEDEEGEASVGAYVRRLRLRFDGYVGSPKFLYAIQLSFAPDDVGEIQDGGNLNIIRDAVIFYRPSDFWTFSFGQTKLPGNRQRLNSSGALQLTDRSINNARFNIDRDFGFQVHNLNEFKDRFSYNFKLALTTGNGRNTTVEGDQGLSYTGKVELFPFGSFAHSGSTFEGDIERESRPKVLLSAAYNYNDRALKSQGVLGRELSEARSQSAWLLDAMLKYQGFTAMMAYMDRHAKDPVISGVQGTPEYVFVGWGTDYQASYLFPSNFEVIGRFSAQKADRAIHVYTPHQNQYTLGLTKYIWEHAFKFQVEASLNRYRYPDAGIGKDWYTRFQIEMGI
ncbi:MAG: OprO/OprP family phosphate-selective porin [Leadbetterella sp.]|nr:OprO/OprP family phosphate-selective porin [Leadbetterella sp.]